ncbi:hypothetical protein [Pseudidiomarina sp.]|uniref:hypothetical protein n=1 Tax=Pseudidiomarina sp. TaxID=2081707 RepID=UPI003A97520C
MQDKTYGLRVAKSSEKQLSIADEKWVWLDVTECEDLQSLELAARGEYEHERHLTLSKVPHLKSIRNSLQLPLVVHFDAYARHQPLFIEGPVRHIDFCWDGGEFNQTREYQQVLLLPIQQLNQYRHEVERLRTDALLVLFEPQTGDSVATSTVIQLKTAAQVVITELSNLQQLHLEPAHKAKQGEACVTVRKCRQLELVNQLAGLGRQVSIYDSASTRLKFTGQWQEIALVGCGIHRLSVEQAHALYVRGVCYIEEVHVPNTMRVVNEATNSFSEGVFPEINESTLRELKHQLQAEHKPELMQQCLAAVQRCERTKTRYYAIQLLQLLAARTDEAEMRAEIFAARKRLLPAGTKRPFPHDLRLEGWRSDVNLWHMLRRDGDNEALMRYDNFFTDYFARTNEVSDSIYAFISECLELGNDGLLAIGLRQFMPAEPQQSKKRRANHHFWQTQQYVQGIKRLVLFLPRLNQVAKTNAIEFVLLSLSHEMLTVAVQKMLELEPALTRKIALRIANRHSEAREVYLRLALSAAAATPKLQFQQGELV